MTNNEYRKLWLKLHRSYEKKALRIFLKSIRKTANNIPFDNLTERDYRILIESTITEDNIKSAYKQVYFEIGTLHGRRIGRGINRDIKAFLPDAFTQLYRSVLNQWIIYNSGFKITSVRQNLIDYIVKEIQKGIAEELDIRKIAKNIKELVNSRKFYRWQAMRIARTETTAAANFGATVAGETSGVVLEKVWISSRDARTRRRPDDKYDHWQLDGVKVEQNGLFEDGNAFLRFPGDPTAPAGSVINCRCTTALVPKRDSNGRLVFI